MRIVVIAPQEPAAFFDLLWQGVWEATFDIAQFGVEVANVTPPRHDVEAQRSILADLLHERVDAIAMVPVHDSALDDLIGLARRQGSFRRHFPFRRPPKRTDVICRARCVPLRRPRRRTALQVDGRVGRVLTFPGPRHAYHLAQRYDGLRREVERNPGLNEVVACIDSDLAAGVVELIRHAGPIDGIYVGSEQIVEVAKALQECELHIPCVGFTNSEEVEPFVKSGVVSANRR